MIYDLHSHSRFSDGSLTPSELVSLASSAGVSYLALTDHDTIAGLEQAKLAAQESDLNIIQGVELSCSWQGQLLHIVGLNINAQDDRLLQGIAQNRDRRLQRAEAMHSDFKQHGICLVESVNEQLAVDGVPTRPHFANALVEQGLAKNKKQAFKRYLVKGKPGFIPMVWPSLAEVGAWVQSAGGVAVLAHPMRYRFTRTRLIRLIKEMQEAGIHGLEVSTPTTNVQQTAMLAELCREHKLVASIGSDFHSPNQAWARLGSAPDLPSAVTPVWQAF